VDSVLNDYRGNLLASQNGRTVESAGPIALGVRLMSSQNPQTWRTIVYEKGTWIMHKLRRRMGDERFLGFLGESDTPREAGGLMSWAASKAVGLRV